MNKYLLEYIGVDYYPYEELEEESKEFNTFKSLVDELSALAWVNSTKDYVYEVSITNNDHKSTIISSSVDLIIDLLNGLKGYTEITIIELTKNPIDYNPIDDTLTFQTNWF